jgi:ubiquinone/menaquinone biosynthesis C-methylase UbiE
MTRERKPSFDRIARPYRCMEYLTFGHELERCRCYFLPRLGDRGSALVLGDGDGRFLAALLAAAPELRADTVDSSAAMLRLLERRSHNPSAAARLRVYKSDALAFEPDGSYDLVATHFFLDCFAQPDLDALVRRIAPHLRPNAVWLVSDFHIPTGAMRWPARILIRLLYFAFRVLTGLRVSALPDHGAALTEAGFALIERRHALGGVLITELWGFERSAES